MNGIRRLEHVGVVVEDLEAVTEFFLGLEREGTASVQDEWVENVVGLNDVHADLVVVRTPDGNSRLELTKFHTPADDRGPHAHAANRLGIRHIAFAVDDLNAMVEKLKDKGIGAVGKVQNYEDLYLLCYIRGPEGIIVELAEQIGSVPAS